MKEIIEVFWNETLQDIKENLEWFRFTSDYSIDYVKQIY